MAQRKYLQRMNVDRGPRDEITLDRLRDRLRAFAEARDWNQFHTPKNLAIALSVEAGELLEHFQWISGKDSLTLPPDSSPKSNKKWPTSCYIWSVSPTR